jgi:hypothetical protein
METAWFGMETFGMETAKHGVFRSFGWLKMAQNWTHAAWLPGYLAKGPDNAVRTPTCRSHPACWPSSSRECLECSSSMISMFPWDAIPTTIVSVDQWMLNLISCSLHVWNRSFNSLVTASVPWQRRQSCHAMEQPTAVAWANWQVLSY